MDLSYSFIRLPKVGLVAFVCISLCSILAYARVQVNESRLSTEDQISLIQKLGGTYVLSANNPATIESISLSATNVVANDLRRILNSQLDRLFLRNTRIGDDAMDYVRQYPSLSLIDLSRTEITDKGVLKLASNRKLRHVVLEGCKIGDSSMAALAKLDGLCYLSISSTNIGDVGFNQLNPDRIETLFADSTKITDKSLEALFKYPKLTSLGLSNTAVSDNGLKQLRRHQTIRHLDLGHTKVTDSGVKSLATCAAIRYLFLENTLITDNCVDSLVEMPNLRYLVVKNTSLTSAGIRRIKQHLKDINVEE